MVFNQACKNEGDVRTDAKWLSVFSWMTAWCWWVVGHFCAFGAVVHSFALYWNMNLDWKCKFWCHGQLTLWQTACKRPQLCLRLLTSGDAHAAMNGTNAEFKCSNRCWAALTSHRPLQQALNVVLLLPSELFKKTRKLYVFGTVSLSRVIFSLEHIFTC